MFLGIAAARGILYVAICDPERALIERGLKARR
jgi:hypothetical protein